MADAVGDSSGRRAEVGSLQSTHGLVRCVCLGRCARRGLAGCAWWEVGLVCVRSAKPQRSTDFAPFRRSSWRGYFRVCLSLSLMCYLQAWIEAEFKETESKPSVTCRCPVSHCNFVLVQSTHLAVAVFIGFLVRLDSLMVNCKDCIHCFIWHSLGK